MKTKTLIITIAALMLDAASATAATIATSAINNPLCQSLTVHVFFTANGRFDTDNVFTVQLSDMAGTFDNPVNIGSLNGTTSGVIPSVVPAGTPAGTGYRIRVISSLPLVIGSDNGSDLVIKMCNSIQTGAVRGSPFCQGSTVNVPFTADGIFNAGNVFTAQFSDAMGVFDNPVDIGTLAGTGSGTITAVIPYASPPGSA
ncbi:MAG TPA: hypothetical protein VNJ07_12690, partial [Chitinophagales bacterium]|nr:hypothetical protein [Chitinophagales bacterium]